MAAVLQPAKAEKRTLNVTLTNRYASFDYGPKTMLRLKKYFRYRAKGFEFSQAYRIGAWDGYRNLLLRGRVASGLFLERKRLLSKRYNLVIDDLRKFPEFNNKPGTGEARDYQEEALEKMIAASNVGGIVLAATGTGKTRLAADYFRRLVGPAVFVVDELTLLEQSRAEISAVLGEKVGIVGRSLFVPERISVATVQTLHKHRADYRFRRWFESLAVIIIDEIHVAVNRRNVDVVQTVKPLAVFGLTATIQMNLPEVRLPATALTGPVIFRYSIQEGVKEKHLTQGRVCFVDIQDTLTEKTPGYWSADVPPVWMQPWSRAAEYRHRISLNMPRNRCIEKIVREGIRRGRRIIVLAEQIDHLKILTKLLSDIPHRVMSGNKALSGDSSLRIRAMKDMDAGKVRLILASRVFGKGVNVRTVDTIVDATGMPGRDSAIQRYGRGVRTAEGKEELLYIDISDRGNRFAATAKLREKALLETGASAFRIRWNGAASAAKVFIAPSTA
jgi:superfamily II DNA or RNA helicase